MQLTPAVLSFLVIGAHFFRAGHWLLVLVSVILICSLIVREPIIVKIVRAALLLTTIEWLRTAYVFASARYEHGEPWLRLAAILGGVALVSFLSTFLFYTKSLKKMYHLGEAQKPTPDNQKPPESITKRIGPANVQNSADPPSPEFVKIHDAKIILNALSPLLFILMDSFMGLGVLSLLGVGLSNTFLRKKMNDAGGRLSPDDKKASFFKQTIPMLTLSAAVMTYFYLTTEFIRVQLIILPVIAVYTLLVCSAAYWEYIHASNSYR